MQPEAYFLPNVSNVKSVLSAPKECLCTRATLQESEDLQIILLIKGEARQLKAVKRFEDEKSHPEAITIPLQVLIAENLQSCTD